MFLQGERIAGLSSGKRPLVMPAGRKASALARTWFASISSQSG